MSIGESMAMELEHENTSTRKLLERIPEDKMDYKPHEKSFTLGKLASHIVEMLAWTRDTVEKDEFVMDPNEYKPFIGSTTAELLEGFDKYSSDAVEALRSCGDEAMMKTWRMKVGGKTAFEMPRAVVLRSFVLNHGIHHRGQLGVYLRINDVALPQVYGPSADEPDMIPPG